MWLKIRRPDVSRWSIRRKLLCMTSVLLIAVSLLGVRASQTYAQRSAQLSYDRLLTGAALQIAEQIALRHGKVVADLPRAAFETLALAPDDRVYYRILGPDDEHITGYDDLPSAPATRVRHAGSADGDTFRKVFFDARYRGEAVRFVVLERLLTETDFSGYIQIQIGQTTLARTSLADEISLRALQLIGLLFMVALLLVSLGIWMTLRPLERLNSALARRSSVDLSPLDLAVPREISKLVRTINHFMQQLGGTLDGLQRFTSEAAHQIRTPLAGLRSQAQNALDEEDAGLRQRQLNRVLESADRLSDTVNQLLSQAVLAHRLRSQQTEPVALDQLVREQCRQLALPALEQGVELAYDGDDAVLLQANAFALRQMVQNILENAIRYSNPGSEVQVRLEQDESYISLSVADQGPGIPDAEKPLVFERFYRSPNNVRTGSGLGLAIAKDVASYHRASLKLTDNQPAGLVVTVRFHRRRVL
ncbi:sensor histidine kinase [Marinobacterium sedimentorum]|uniref:sensor histidine kinase n=1 Tax=Marinobacterium sedimentorum TaxID=2927804 RepID=UPI0020C65E94|nr:sensor histidine kinase [Marinobacterium sedimentorum]MCP8689437.1 sensor histidine kinase N-terminal domain-containing protein [Marinobacterium sedimentorum]